MSSKEEFVETCKKHDLNDETISILIENGFEDKNSLLHLDNEGFSELRQCGIKLAQLSALKTFVRMTKNTLNVCTREQMTGVREEVASTSEDLDCVVLPSAEGGVEPALCKYTPIFEHLVKGLHNLYIRCTTCM